MGRSFITMLIFGVLISGCAIHSPDEILYYKARSNFRYEADIANEYRVYASIDSPFYGDCEDFAFTLQRQIGGDVYFVMLHKKYPHAVLVKDGVAYDMKFKIGKDFYPGTFYSILHAE
jgi:hypothetical protein